MEVYIDTADRDRNTAIFAALQQDREAIEHSITSPLQWDGLGQEKACRIAAHAPFPVTIDSLPEELQRLKEWAVTMTIEFVEAFRPWLKALPIR